MRLSKHNFRIAALLVALLISTSYSQWVLNDASAINSSMFSTDSSGNHIYFGNSTGIWQSLDGGETWSGINDRLLLPSENTDVFGYYLSPLDASGDTLFLKAHKSPVSIAHVLFV